MKKLKPGLVFLLMLLLNACTNDNHSSEWIKVANLTARPAVEFNKITDIDIINKINAVTEGLIWQDKQIDTIGDSDYSFWLEREGVERRITNYEIWFNENNSSAVIADYVQVKYTHINGFEFEELIQILESANSTGNDS